MIQDHQIRQFKKEDLPFVHRLVENTIDICYHPVYPVEAIEFFKYYHAEERISSDAANGYTVVAEHNGEIVGTGTLWGTNIRRVFVNPHLQHGGIGKLIVRELERKALLNNAAILDLSASLVSKQFWETLGFVVQKEDYVPVQNGQKLHFYRMAKTLSRVSRIATLVTEG